MLLWAVFVGFMMLMLVGSAGVAWWWGKGFDEAETLGAATASTDTAMVARTWVAVAGLFGSLLSGPAAVMYERKRRWSRPRGVVLQGQ